MKFRINHAPMWVLAMIGAFAAMPSLASEGAFKVQETFVEDLKAMFATVETADVVQGRARIGGTVSNLMVDEGNVVEQGQVIATVGDAKLKLRMDALQARIGSARSQRDLAETALERAQKLKASGTIAQKRLDEAETALDVIERELSALNAERAVIAEQRVEGEIKAPSGGRVTQVHVTTGAVILPGEPVATIAAKGYILRLQLPERHARFIKEGDVVRIGERGLSADGRDEKTGIVLQVYPELRNGRVIADVTVEDLGDFYVGERVRVYVGAGKRRTFIVPRDYLFTRYGLTFAVLKGFGEIVVQPGPQTEGGTEVLSGLKDGDVLMPVSGDK